MALLPARCGLFGIVATRDGPGIQPTEAVEIAQAVLDAGIRIIEVPLNSPQPFASIERLVGAFGDRALLGAGTVTSTEAVDAVIAAGGRLIVSPISPNTDLAVIARAVERGLDVLPGFMTPTEAFAAHVEVIRYRDLPLETRAVGHRFIEVQGQHGLASSDQARLLVPYGCVWTHCHQLPLTRKLNRVG